jgi:hypothetical protein
MVTGIWSEKVSDVSPESRTRVRSSKWCGSGALAQQLVDRAKAEGANLIGVTTERAIPIVGAILILTVMVTPGAAASRELHQKCPLPGQMHARDERIVPPSNPVDDLGIHARLISTTRYFVALHRTLAIARDVTQDGIQTDHLTRAALKTSPVT